MEIPFLKRKKKKHLKAYIPHLLPMGEIEVRTTVRLEAFVLVLKMQS